MQKIQRLRNQGLDNLGGYVDREVELADLSEFCEPV